MLTPEQMSKVLIAAPKDVIEPVIRELYRKRLFHIQDFVEDEHEEYQGYRIGNPLSGAGETSKELLRLRSVTNAFSLRSDDIDPAEKIRESRLQERIEQELPAIEQEVEDLLSRRSTLENQKKEIEQKIDLLLPFADVPVDLPMLRGYRTMAVIAGYLAKRISLNVPCEEYYSESKRGNLLIVVTPNEYRPEVERMLLDAHFQAIPIPDEKGSAKDRIAEYQVQAKSVEQEISGISEKIQALKANHAGFLVACDELLSMDVERAEVPLRFATTDHAFIAEGWVPSDTVRPLTEDLVTASGGRAFVTELPIQKGKDVVPVEYDNISFARPTQFLMDIYSRPKYTELDPTLIVSIVFPIFFGLILGDVGYGALLLAASFGLRKLLKGPEGKMLLDIMRNASISSIFFGILFSECFGFKLPWPSVLPSRHLNIGGEAGGHGPAIPELMIMCVWIGVLHITAGRLLGILNHARQDHGSHRVWAMLANLGWIMVMWGILIMIWSAFPMPLMPDLTGFPPLVLGLSLPAIIGLLIIVLGVVFIVKESALELVELPTILSHVLSYARLVGVGISSVAIAMVINFIAIGMIIEPQLENITIFSVIVIVVGVIVWIIGQILNTILGMIGGGLQSLRLQYVEFFTKFYKGGGVKYNPFGVMRKFSED
ncbi:MAG: V-type ATP synthase subunit I [Methanoregulaceae archaeon]|nr:V-type ATP synthase subunit I [Methanoregulaceae archaeon]